MKRIISAVLVLFSGYIIADAWDIAPGIFTTAPVIPDVAPAPSVTFPIVNTPQKSKLSSVLAEQEPGIAQTLTALTTDPRIGGTVAAVVVDPFSQKTLAEINSTLLLRPASNEKYLTAAAVLKVLGPQATLDTVAQRNNDDLYLVGGGDILLTEKAAPETPYKAIDDQIIGHANLQDLATQAAKGLEKTGHSYTLYVDSSRYLDPQYHPQIVADGTKRYVMPLRPLAIDRGREGDDPRHPIYAPNPDLLAGEAFAEELRAQGFQVTLADRAQAPEGSTEIGRVHSASIEQIVGLMLQKSDNSLAEMLAHEIAKTQGLPANFAGAAQAMRQVLENEKYSLDGVIIDDGSGLSGNNRLSPKAIAEVLQRAWSCDGCAEKSMVPELAVGGLSGTLEKRFTDQASAGVVYAKTGTLATTSALSGYVVTAQGHPLIFAIIVTDYEPGQHVEVRAAIDDTVTQLVTNF